MSDASDVKARLHDVVIKLFKDAGVGFQRMSSRGISYSSTAYTYQEYLHRFDMLWRRIVLT